MGQPHTLRFSPIGAQDFRMRRDLVPHSPVLPAARAQCLHTAPQNRDPIEIQHSSTAPNFCPLWFVKPKSRGLKNTIIFHTQGDASCRTRDVHTAGLPLGSATQTNLAQEEHHGYLSTDPKSSRDGCSFPAHSLAPSLALTISEQHEAKQDGQQPYKPAAL